MIDLFFIIAMGALSGLAGASYTIARHLDGDGLRFSLAWLPELLFAVGFVYPWLGIAPWYILPVIVAVSYLAMERGHWTVLAWDTVHKDEFSDRKRPTLEPLVDWLYRVMTKHKPMNRTQYSCLFMGVKGFLISLPIAGLGVVAWPLGYELGHRLKDHAMSEFLSGAFMGVIIVAFKYALMVI